MANVDFGHYVAAGSGDPVVFLEKFHDRISSFHLKDRKSKENGGANVVWGQGDTPIARLLQTVQKHKYKMPATIEMEYDVPEGSTPVAEVRKCAEFCRRCSPKRSCRTASIGSTAIRTTTGIGHASRTAIVVRHRTPGAPAATRRLSSEGARNPNLMGFHEVVKCARCGAPVDPGILSLSTCARCGQALHACVQCAHFNTGATFECTQPIKARLSPKDAANDARCLASGRHGSAKPVRRWRRRRNRAPRRRSTTCSRSR